MTEPVAREMTCRTLARWWDEIVRSAGAGHCVFTPPDDDPDRPSGGSGRWSTNDRLAIGAPDRGRAPADASDFKNVGSTD